jgi:hypothetical protein
MEAREMLSASPVASPRALLDGRPPELFRAETVATPTPTPANLPRPVTDRPVLLAARRQPQPLPLIAQPSAAAQARIDRQYVEAIRSRGLNAWREMLATVRAQDRAAWRGIVRAVDSGSPRAWSLMVSAFRKHLPDVPGVPARRPGELGVATSTPSLALPLGPEFDIGTRWSIVLPVDPLEYLDPPIVAMGPDSTVWGVFALDTQAVYQYDPMGQAWYHVWDAPGRITSLAAGQSDSVYANHSLAVGYTVNGAANLAYLTGSSSYGTYLSVRYSAAVPGNPASAQVAASQATSPSQPVYTLASNGAVLRWTGASPTPRSVPVPTGGLNLTQITVAGVDDLWGVATTSGANQSYQLVNGTWVAGPALANLASLAGAGDGSLWAQTSGGNLYTLSADGTQWLAVTSLSALPGQNPTITDVVTPSSYVAFAAGSKYRAVAANPQGGVQLLTYGLGDQPTTGFPAVNQAAYAYINQLLEVTAPGGVRSMYQNAADLGALTGYQSTLLGLTTAPVPAGLNISLADWRSTTNEIYNEVFSVVSVYNYFTLINGLTADIGGKVGTLLSNTSQQIQLSESHQKTPFEVIFGDIFSAALSGIVKAFSGGAGVVASLVASGISDGLSAATAGRSNQGYALDYFQLSTTLYNTFNNAQATNSALMVAILADPNRFLPFGVGVQNGTIQWPDNQSEAIAAATLNAFQASFFQSLTPLAWPIYYATGYPADSVEGCYPSYTSTFVPDSPGSKNGTIYVLGSPGAFGFDFPNQNLNLLSTIVSVTGVSQADVLTNQLGWWKPIEKDAFFMLAECQGPPPVAPSQP